MVVFRSIALILVLASVLTGQASAAPPVDLGGTTSVPGPVDLGHGGGYLLHIYGINEAGEIAGETQAVAPDGASHAFTASAAGGMVDLGRLGGTAPNAVAGAFSVSDTGTAVGYSSVDRAPSDPPGIVYHAFRWTQASGMVDLGTLGGRTSAAFDVNADGVIAGESAIAGDAATHAFSWTQASGMIDLGTLPGATCPAQGPCSSASKVNAGGMIAGTSRGADSVLHAVVWMAGGGIVDLGSLGSPAGGVAEISDSGQVVGHRSVGGIAHAFSWTQAGGMVDIAPPSGDPQLWTSQSWAWDVNASGQVVGSVDGRPFLWTHAGGLVDLGSLPGGTGRGWARSINESGQIVGYSDVPGAYSTPFLWTPATGMIDLGRLENGVSAEATLISDSGHIAGTGFVTQAEQARPRVLAWSAADFLPHLDPIPAAPLIDTASPAPPSAPATFAPIATPAAPATVVAKRIVRAAVVSRSRSQAAEINRFLRSLKSCKTAACKLRAVTSFATKQRAYAAFLRSEGKRPATCGAAARRAHNRLRESAAATTGLRRALLAKRRGAAEQSRARAAALRALAASGTYAAACA